MAWEGCNLYNNTGLRVCKLVLTWVKTSTLLTCYLDGRIYHAIDRSICKSGSSCHRVGKTSYFKFAISFYLSWRTDHALFILREYNLTYGSNVREWKILILCGRCFVGLEIISCFWLYSQFNFMVKYGYKISNTSTNLKWKTKIASA